MVLCYSINNLCSKIVEYILIPNVAESHFVIIVSMLMIFVANSLATQYFCFMEKSIWQ